MYQLYRGDYRVRIYIANCLNDAASALEKASESVLPLDEILIQTALCFEIGFGVARDQHKSYSLLKRRKSNEVEFARKLDIYAKTVSRDTSPTASIVGEKAMDVCNTST